MGRRKRDENISEEQRINLPAHVKREKPSADPYAVSRGPVNLPHQEVLPPIDGGKSLTGQAAAFAFERYCETLARTGDVIEAVADAMEMTKDQVGPNVVEFEKRIIEAAPDLSMDRMLKRFRASEPIRLAILGRMLMHDNPAVVLKAEERLSELQGAAGNRRQGVKAEDLIRLALQKIAEKNKKSKAS